MCAPTLQSASVAAARGEAGVVLSRYHRIDGYDWLAIPLIPYLYAVDDPSEIPTTATPRLEIKLRDGWRREHLESIVPDSPKHEIPRGEWVELVALRKTAASGASTSPRPISRITT